MRPLMIPLLVLGVLGAGSAFAGDLAAGSAAADDLATAVRLLDEGWGSRAEAKLIALAGREPDQAEVWYRLAWVRFRAGDYEAAEKYVERALELEPDNPGYLVLQGHAAGRRAQTGSKLKAMGRARKCRKCYEQALEIDPGNVEARISLIRFLVEAPGIVGGDRDRARELARACEEFDPVEAKIMQGLVLERSGEIDAAFAAYRRAVTISRETGAKRNRAMWVYLDTCYQFGRLDEARVALDEDLAIPGREVGARMGLADLARRTGDPDGARARWEQLAAADSTRFDALMGLGYLEAGQENFAAAAALFDSARAVEPDRRDALYQASRVRLNGGLELDRSISGLREYLAKEINLGWPPAGWARVHLAEALLRAGDEKAAWEQLSLLGKDPLHDDRLKKRIEDLEDRLDDDWGG